VNKFIIIAIVAVLLLAGGGAAYYFLVISAETGGAEPAPKIDDRAYIYVEIPPVVANFDVKGKMRYVQITTSIQTRDAESGNTIKNNIPLIQSDLLTLMQSAEFDEINSSDGKARFIEQIEKSVNNMFKNGPKPFEMERAMITGFVIQ
jgi:flagellar FliL protein